MKNKRGFLDISFSWIFAFLIGAMILTGAIYGINKFSSIKNTQNSAELGVALKNLLTPLESGVETTKSITITLPVLSKINHGCDNYGNFGGETFSLQEKVKNKWTNSGVPISFKDKYIFTPEVFEGQTFNIFSKPFNFPFKVANLIYFSNSKDKYCFVGFSRGTETELKNLNQNNFEFGTCSTGAIKVCLGGNSNCDINVKTSDNSVEKNGEKVYFETDALMYAAIFSDKITYECELKRLMKRADELTDIYSSKSANLIQVGCSSSVDFTLFRQGISNLEDSEDLVFINQAGKNMDSINKYSGCRLW